MELMHHRDCRNFAAVDVAKGICHRTKNMVPADGDQCEECVATPKCKGCRNFTADAKRVELGVCEASTATPKFFAYPDMVALTCEMFREQ